jgi:starch synthase (maltosyl-transferring)
MSTAPTVRSDTMPQAIPVNDGRRRVVVENVQPTVDGGRFPAKQAVGDEVVVHADVFCDGHDAIAVVVRYRPEAEVEWREVEMEPLGNDRWRGRFQVETVGAYRFAVAGWVDRFASWRRDFVKRADAGQELSVDAEIGAQIVDAAARQASGSDARALKSWAARIHGDAVAALDAARDEGLATLVRRNADRSLETTSADFPLWVDRVRARFSTWYELFPRSAGAEGRHGTFKDVEERLDYVAELGFDVLYLPPIHPIGSEFRKGPNNNPESHPGDLGSPWAIGSAEGGHTAIHPELGTLEDFRHLAASARERGIDVALDLAYQCAPDHPWVKEHPEWFRARPDGTIQYAENPPKKYQDIYPIDFETPAWRELWQALADVVRYWVEQGVRIFRVDNPHTKAFPFWEWMIPQIKSTHPEVIFLAEAFTRPRVMQRLAKLGFTQSYTYFAWRTSKWELTQYMTELTRTNVANYMRPNFWPNTPDILTEQLQIGGRPMFIQRLVLAATLTASYGIYGPAFELGEHLPVRPGSEEYLDSEKYQIRNWDLEAPWSLRDLIVRVNAARKENPALQRNDTLEFHQVDNDNLLAYTKRSGDGPDDNLVLCVVNLDPHHTQSGWLHLPLEQLGLDPQHSFQVHDLLSDSRYLWQGHASYVELNPHVLPAHIFRIRRRMRSEHDFDYYA